MTKIILTGLTLATLLLTIGISSQSFAMPMTDKTQNAALGTTITGNITPDGQEWRLVGISPTTKGGATTYQIVPKSVEGIDTLSPAQPADPHPLIQVGTPLIHKGETATNQLVPQPDPSPYDFIS